jgi:hypothetical protein
MGLLLILGILTAASGNGSPVSTNDAPQDVNITQTPIEIGTGEIGGAILAAHNKYRSEVGSPPLVWSDSLASSAQTWANYLAENFKEEYSGPGENIWVGEEFDYCWTKTVDSWAAEKNYFMYGPFGDGSSTTGKWEDVRSYTQMIWHDSLYCGCGAAMSYGPYNYYYVCQYSPQGNIFGQYPYPRMRKDYVGVFRSGRWYLDYSGDGVWNTGDKTYSFGLATDKPVTGDWNKDTNTEAGVFRSGRWYLDYSGDGVWNAGDKTYSFGMATDIPVGGDWNGDGKTEAGVFRSGKWYLDYSGDGVWNAGDKTYSFGMATDIPVSGDWNGDGKTEAGVFRSGKWYLDYTGEGAWNTGDKTYSFGKSTDKPVSGDWNGDKKAEIGAFRSGTWYLDYTGEGIWNAGDKSCKFGLATDKPVSGDWV